MTTYTVTAESSNDFERMWTIMCDKMNSARSLLYRSLRLVVITLSLGRG